MRKGITQQREKVDYEQINSLNFKFDGKRVIPNLKIGDEIKHTVARFKFAFIILVLALIVITFYFLMTFNAPGCKEILIRKLELVQRFN